MASSRVPDNTPTCTIPLTRGFCALVDCVDYQRLMARHWFVVTRSDGRCYAGCWVQDGAGHRKLLHMHVEIMQPPNGMEVDHRDGDGLNNTRQNLRLCTRSQNQANRKRGSNNTSGFKGVTWAKVPRKWRAQGKANGKFVHLGYYDDARSAARAYNDWARATFGEYALLNDDHLV